MGKVIYVTGAPATGKSTLCATLAVDQRTQAFCYSRRLRDHVNRRLDSDLDEADIRRRSANVVTATHVHEVDDMLQAEVESIHATDKYLLIDSHPVTKEDFGFRVTPFTLQRLLGLGIDHFICLYADPQVLARRIRQDPRGRPLPNLFELSVHVELQASIVSTYSVLSGRPCYLVDSGVSSTDLVKRVRDLIGLD